MLTGSDLGAAIRAAIAAKGVTQTTVAEHFGVRQSSITDWLKRGTISKDKLPELWAYFSDVVGPEHWGLSNGTTFQRQWQSPSRDVSGMADLISPPASPESETRTGDLASLPQFSTDDYVSVPYAQAKLSAGAHGFNIEYQQGTREPLYFLRSWFNSRGLNPRKVFAADLSGPSMQKSMPDGDTVLVNTDAQEPREDKVFAALYDGEMVIKRLRREDGAWWLISDNDDQVRFAPKKCDASCRLVGQVVLKMSETI